MYGPSLLDLVTEQRQLPSPVVSTGAALDANDAGRQLGKEAQQLAPRQTTTQDGLSVVIDAVNLETDFAKIETRGATPSYGPPQLGKGRIAVYL